MNGFRRLAANHRSLAALILVAALMIRILVPSGFMPVVAQGGITIVPCSGIVQQPAQTAMAMPGMVHHEMARMAHAGTATHAPAAPNQHEGSGADTSCIFAGLAMPAVAGADPLLLVIALAFLMLLAARVPTRPSLGAALRLRPPLRGPPAFS